MGQIKPPAPVKLIVGMLSATEPLFAAAQEQMATLWGPIDVIGTVLDFANTDYYTKEMGPNLLRRFVAFAELIDPGQLAQIKHTSNALEEQLARTEIGVAAEVARPINLDPGYIDPSKLILATTKNYSHRIYIGGSMYAEATLHYHKGKWLGWPYTYPDYAGGTYDEFLNQTRQRLMEQLSSQKTNT